VRKLFFPMALVASLILGACGSDGSYTSGITCEQARELDQELIDNIAFAQGRAEFELGEPIEVTLSVTNCSDARATIRYRDAQRYDFTVSPVGAQGREVWRWSQGKTSAQVLGEETFEPGETKTYTEVWDQMSNLGEQVSPGRYVLSAGDLRCEFEAPPSCASGISVVIGIMR